MVRAQGGDVTCLERPERLPRAQEVLEAPAPASGRFRGLRARPVGEWITEAGGGRLRTDDRIDPRVGVEQVPAVGSTLRAGDPLVRLHLPEGFPTSGRAAEELRARASSWAAIEPPEAAPDSGLVLEIVRPEASGG
jgi:thymidine phosphorylase